jgi:hypothetical protein
MYIYTHKKIQQQKLLAMLVQKKGFTEKRKILFAVLYTILNNQLNAHLLETIL